MFFQKYEVDVFDARKALQREWEENYHRLDGIRWCATYDDLIDLRSLVRAFHRDLLRERDCYIIDTRIYRRVQKLYDYLNLWLEDNLDEEDEKKDKNRHNYDDLRWNEGLSDDSF